MDLIRSGLGKPQSFPSVSNFKTSILFIIDTCKDFSSAYQQKDMLDKH